LVPSKDRGGGKKTGKAAGERFFVEEKGEAKKGLGKKG